MKRVRAWVYHQRSRWAEVLAGWRRLERYERRKHVVHVGLLTWLSHAIVREWRAVTELDLTFFLLAVAIELEERTRGKVYAWPALINREP